MQLQSGRFPLLVNPFQIQQLRFDVHIQLFSMNNTRFELSHCYFYDTDMENGL